MKSISILLFALAGAIFTSCNRENPAGSRANENQTWVILAKADLQDDSDFFQGIWNPSESETPHVIQEARLYLEKLKTTTSSKSEQEKIAEILARWDKYLCQVVGHAKDDKKLMHLNFFPKKDTTEEGAADWRHTYMVAFGGGADYWQIEYDYKAKAFSDFESNSDD